MDDNGEVRRRPEAAGGARLRPRASPEPNPDEPDPEGEVTGVLQQPQRAALPRRVRRPRPPPDPGTAGGGHAERGGFDQRAGAGDRYSAPGYLRADRRARSRPPRCSSALGASAGTARASVIVVNGGDVHDQAVFAHPQSFFHRPLAESALYLENEHIQYIHTLCLARPGGEHDQVLSCRS